MVEERAVRRIAAILSADAVGYSRLMARSEERTARALSLSRRLMTELVVGRGGRVVDSVGDNLLAEFPSVVEAVRCAVEIQQELARRNSALLAEDRLLFRIGVNLGDVLVENDRIVGDSVNVAARLEALAEPGGICLSGTAYDQVEGRIPIALESDGEHVLKNISRPVRVYHVCSDRSAARPNRKRVIGWALASIVIVVIVGGAALMLTGRWTTGVASSQPPSQEVGTSSRVPGIAFYPFST